jgi:hypothetical protein
MWKQIFKATLIAGVLDLSAASSQAYISKNITPDVLLKYIASGLLGKGAFDGGWGCILLGLFVHFLIVFFCATTYFVVYPKLKLLNNNILLSSFFVALIAWAITTRIIIPLSKIQPPPFDYSKVVLALSILYCCIGLPITILAKNFYNKRRTT